MNINMIIRLLVIIFVISFFATSTMFAQNTSKPKPTTSKPKPTTTAKPTSTAKPDKNKDDAEKKEAEKKEAENLNKVDETTKSDTTLNNPDKPNETTKSDYVLYRMKLADDIDLVASGTLLLNVGHLSGIKYDDSRVDGTFDSGYGYGFEIDANLIRMLKEQLYLGLCFEYYIDPPKNMLPIEGVAGNVNYTYGGLKYNGSTRLGPSLLGLWHFSNIPLVNDLFTGLKLSFLRNRADLVFISYDYNLNKQVSSSQTNDGLLLVVSGVIEAPVINLGNLFAIKTRLELGYQIGKNDQLTQNALNIMLKAGVGF